MEFNVSEAIEHIPCASSEMKSFDVQLLLSSIHNTDDLVHKYNTKCSEYKQLQENLVSLSNLSTQIRQLYACEKEKNDKLMLDKQTMNEESQRLKAELAALQHDQINNETLHKQTIAELEYQLETTTKTNAKKYVELCESIVAQGLILHTNGLSTTSLSKKCAHARDVLKSHNRPFDWTESRSALKMLRSPTKTTTKCKCNSIASPTKNATSSNQPNRSVMTSEKGTMCTQTTATRSTCTSAFIRKVDASTNTIADQTDTELCSIVQKILDEMVPLPSIESPIHQEIAPLECVVSSNGSKNGSTQTDTKMYRNQGTITCIRNVRKRVNYIRNDNDSNQSTIFDESLRRIKKEDITSPFGSMTNLLMSQHIAREIPFNGDRGQQLFMHLWILLGEILFPIANQTVDYQKSTSFDPKLMEKLHQIQSMLGTQPPYSSFPNDIAGPCIDLMTDSGDENVSTSVSLIKESTSDCSQDSIRYSESDGIIESGMNDFCMLSAFADDNSMDASQAAALHAPIMEKRPIPKETINTNAVQTNNTIEMNVDCHQFKVPKRKLMRETSEENKNKNKRKRKTEKKVIVKRFGRFRFDSNVFSHLQTKCPRISAASNLFDDPEPEPEQVPTAMENIFEYFRCPKILSPIHDLEDATSNSMQTDLNINESVCTLSIESTIMDATTVSETVSAFDSTPTTERIEHESNEVNIDKNVEMDVATNIENHPTPKITKNPIVEIDEISVALNANQIPNKQTEENVTNAKDALESLEPMEDSLYDYSPASPPPEPFSSEMPAIIPLYTQINSTAAMPSSSSSSSLSIITRANDSSQSIFDRLIKGYSHIKRTNLLKNIKKTLTVDESYIIASLRNSIETLCMQRIELTSAAVTECTEKMLNLTWRPMLLAKALLEVIEDTTDTMCYDFTPPSPAMTQTHQKCLLLIVRIDRMIPAFMKYMEYQLNRSLFQFLQSLKLPAIINLTHLYIGLIDLEQPNDRSKVRLFIYKCLYYYTHKATPMIYAMLMAHPYVLPHANTVSFETDPLSRMIISVITNIRYTSNGTTPTNSMYRKTELYNVLKRRYGYFAVKSFPIECEIDYCAECIRSGRLMNVDYALILLAKRQGSEWATKAIIEKHLLPMLHTYVSSDIVHNAQNDERICTVLFTIASIIKTYSLEQNIDYYLNIFGTCLNASNRPTIQEAAISAMCQLSRFGCTKLYPYISSWKPTHEVSPKIMAMLNTVVYQKARNFWYASKS